MVPYGFLTVFTIITQFSAVDPWEPMPAKWQDPGYMKLKWIKSPNADARLQGSEIDTVVIHATVIPTLKSTVEAFYRTESQVSAHFTIGKDGSIVQMVDTNERAWHAGVSRDSEGRTGVNHFSVGIELVNLNDGKDPFPKAQIDALKAVLTILCRRYEIKQFCSHEYVAQPPGRKSDPANFPWEELKGFGKKIYVGKNLVKPNEKSNPVPR
jgi:N-acetyl-anhydromuramyl-L-alanine amidase AmpD